MRADRDASRGRRARADFSTSLKTNRPLHLELSRCPTVSSPQGQRRRTIMAEEDAASDLSAPPSDLESQLAPTATLKATPTRQGKRGTNKRKAETMTVVSPKSTKKIKTAAVPNDPIQGSRSKATPKSANSPETTKTKRTLAKSRTRIRRTEVKTEITQHEEEADQHSVPGGDTGASPRARKKIKVKKEVEVQEAEVPEDAKVKPARRKRKTKEEKEAEMLPLASRTVGSKLFIGAHVSSAGGVHNAVVNSVHIGGNAFALFLKSQRKWANPPLIDDHCTAFVDNCNSHKYEASKHIVPHGSYLVNLCHPDPERTAQAYDAFLDDLTRCNKLGIELYNFHPGNSAGADSREQAIQHLASNLNRSHAEPSAGRVVTLLETMATRGNTIGGTFEDLRDTINLITKKDRVGVCLDTCHVFAAGYDISTAAGLTSVLDQFDATVGLRYLRALHVNDSKAPLSSNRDLHANIGTGFLGLRAFHALVNEPRLWGLPMVLETPIDSKGEDGKEVQDKGIWAREIKLLESMVGMDAESDGFIALEQSLRAKGRLERERIADQVKRREDKIKSPKKQSKKKQDPESELDADST